MKTLANQTLLYDEDCPLCQAYTTAFVKTGMLDDNGRKAFCSLSEKELQFVDVKKAANEIALIDRENKTVTYGIDSLLKVIGHSFPWIEKMGSYKPIHFSLKKMYSFVSYNRKVIIPNPENRNQELKCVPDFSFKYRFAYLFFAILLTSAILFEYAKIIAFLPQRNFSREMLLAAGQLVFQYAFLIGYNRKKIVNYFGNIMTVSIIGALLLLPMFFIKNFFIIPEFAINAWFGIVVLIMFMEHWRRVKLLQLPFYLCLTWVIYRTIALWLILNF